jgi:hypothetical protein
MRNFVYKCSAALPLNFQSSLSSLWNDIIFYVEMNYVLACGKDGRGFARSRA